MWGETHRSDGARRGKMWTAGLCPAGRCAILPSTMPVSTKRASPAGTTLPFERFWTWLQAHANCILRAGTPDAMLFDHDDYHWHLAAEEEGSLIVQLVRGKELVGEIVVMASEIAYVQCELTDNEEYVFECIVETEAARDVAYYFVMAHGFDETEPSSVRRWTH